MRLIGAYLFSRTVRNLGKMTNAKRKKIIKCTCKPHLKIVNTIFLDKFRITTREWIHQYSYTRFQANIDYVCCYSKHIYSTKNKQNLSYSLFLFQSIKYIIFCNKLVYLKLLLKVSFQTNHFKLSYGRFQSGRNDNNCD